MKSRILACFIISLLIQFSVFGRGLVVPSHQYPTINSAVQASQDGDIIVVQNIAANGGAPYTVPAGNGVVIPSGVSNLTIQSFNPLDSQCIAETVIDCQDSGRAFTLPDDQDSHIIITGFTIINGRTTGPVGVTGTIVDPCDETTWVGGNSNGDGYAGAIYIGSITPGNPIEISPEISRCVFSNCKVYGAVGGTGAFGRRVISGIDPIDAIDYEEGDSFNGGRGGDGIGNGYGGALYCGVASTPNIYKCSFYSNSAYGGIGGLGGDSADVQDDKYPGDGGQGGDGYGDGQGGAIYVDELSVPVITANCIFTENAASGPVAGTGGFHGDGKLDDTDHPVFDGSPGEVYSNNVSYGGAIYYAKEVDVELDTATFNYNDADNSGGAIYCAANVILNIISDCSFNGNEALGGSGGAIELEGLCKLDVNDTKFLSNFSHSSGGAINSNAAGDIYLVNSAFSSNRAGIDTADVYVASSSGGALSAVDNTSLEIESCSFSLNIATLYGGAVNAIGPSDSKRCRIGMKSCSVIGNEALLGGGIYFDKFQCFDYLPGDPAPDLFNNCTFMSNTASDSGGGIYLVDSNPALDSKIVECEISDNSAQGYSAWGGGAVVWNCGTSFENCRILRNNSKLSGGGIYFIFPYNTSIKNCLLTDNSTLKDGSAVSINFNMYFSSIDILNCTFSRNIISGITGPGGCVYNNGASSPVIRNCIFNQCNKVAVYEAEASSVSTLTNNLFYANEDGDYKPYISDIVDTVYVGADEINALANATDNIDGDPLFVTGELGDYYLSQLAAGQFQQSPAVDGGDVLASAIGLDNYTTRNDDLINPADANDVNQVDIGYHYRKSGDMPKYTLTYEVVIVDPNNNDDTHGTLSVIPVAENNEYYLGTIVTLVADPDFGYRIDYWDGTESDSSLELTNQVIMNSDRTVRVKFELPKVLEVKANGGPDYYSNIRDAIFDAKDGDVIKVYEGIYRGGVIELFKNVVIRSTNPYDPQCVANTIIDRQGYITRAFYISSLIDNRTEINGLTMRNCGWTWAPPIDAQNPTENGGDGTSFEGGCIFIAPGASPIIKNCIMEDNYGQAGNGSRGYDSTDTFNAGRGGWGGWSRGGAVYCGTGSAPQFINCSFQRNEAIGGNGGNGGDRTHPATLPNYGGNWSTFMSPEFPNVDPGTNGMINMLNPANTDITRELWERWNEMAPSTWMWSGYYIDEIDITGYYGDYKWYGGYGGAVYCGLQSNVTFKNCTITDNSVLSGMSGIGGSGWEPRVSYELPSFGAGVYCDADSNTIFDSCTISNNVASQLSGRYRLNAIASHGGGVCSEETASVTFLNCEISNNQADVGGGIHFANSSPVITDCNFTNNTAMMGGGLYGNSGIADIIGCDFIDNISMSLTDPCTVYDIEGSGGGMFISDLDVNIVDCFISQNICEDNGGGIAFTDGSFQYVENCLITENIAGKAGAGIHAALYAEPTISNCTITKNDIAPLSVVVGSSVGQEEPVGGPSTYEDQLTPDQLNNFETHADDSPPQRPESVTMFLQGQESAEGDVVLPVPTSTWTYGCSATAAGMIFGYYDRNGYPNMYTGPTNNGIVPLTNVGQGDNPGDPISGACSIIATQNGFDGRTTDGHVDDYWIAMGEPGPDPWVSNDTNEHTWGQCTADYMGTNQWKWDSDGDDVNDYNTDGGTLWRYNGAEKLYDFIPSASRGLPQTMGCHGMRLFAESRGYIVTENYNQYIDVVADGGFSFEEYKAEIDAGRPVLIHVTGHSMVGVGYNDETTEVILHDTWDNQNHRMAWGGYYGDMLHYSMTVIKIELPSTTSGGGVTVSNNGRVNIIDSIIWDNTGSEVSVGVAEEPSSAHISYSNIGPDANAINVDPNCLVPGWDLEMYPDTNGWSPDTYNINKDPLFVDNYLLSQVSAGQTVDSPSVDSGSDLASVLGFAGYTTRTDSGPDEGAVDMGYHHIMFDPDIVELNFNAITDPNLTVQPVIDPCGITNYPRYTTAVLTVNAAPANYQILWTGTDDDTLTTTTNTVYLDNSKNVTVAFVKDSYTLTTRVIGDGGTIEALPAPVDGLYARGTLVTLTAVPDPGYRVKQWTGTIDDTSTELVNYVEMTDDIEVTLEYEEPGVISVPGDYSSIQEAIDNAKELDTILLASGTYRTQEGFELSGKNITITSSNPSDPNTVSGTIIQRLYTEEGSGDRAFTFTDVGPQTVLNGLTIRNFGGNTRDGDDGDSDPNTWMNRSGRNGVTNAGGAVGCFKASPTIKNCIFEESHLGAGDGGDGVDGIEGTTLESITGGMGGWPGACHGGAVAMYCSTGYDDEEIGPSNPTFINCSFINCSVQGGNGGNGGNGYESDEINGPPGLGGGWYYGPPYTYYYNTYVYWPWGYHFQNSYEGYFYYLSGDGTYDEYTRYSGLGGAVYVGSDCSPVFKNCNFQGNRSYGGSCGINGLHGGATSRVEPAIPFKIDTLGGAVYCDTNSTPYFYDCNFLDNEADANVPENNNKAFISFGGAVAARDDAKPVFEKCTFNNNFASVGGGLYCSKINATIIDCNFVGNSAFHGGGLYYSDGDAILENSTVASNFTTQPPDPNVFDDEIFGVGAGIYINSSTAAITDCNISMNYTGQSGGGLYFTNSDTTVKNCLITSNIAGRDGAGITNSWSSNLDLINCTIANNVIDGLNFQAPFNYGGGLDCSYSSYANIINSIFWANAADSGTQIALESDVDHDSGTVYSAIVDISNSIVLGGRADIFIDDNCTLNWDAGTNSYHDPKFVSGVIGDYFLSTTDIDDPNQTDDSPAIDAGSDYASAYDLQMHRKTTRTDGVADKGIVDIGYHYSIGDYCRYCDLNKDKFINFEDFALFAMHWLDAGCSADNQWCEGADITVDTFVNNDDLLEIAQCWLSKPQDMLAKWLVNPYSVSAVAPFSIAMEAQPVISNWGWDIEYYFECITDPNFDSGWQPEPDYEATALEADTEYEFRFKVRDLSLDYTESDWSTTRIAMTGSDIGDITAPEPNPMTWDIEPIGLDPNTVYMRATQAIDNDDPNAAVQYYFECVSGTGTDSGWQTDIEYTDETVDANTLCVYRVFARDLSRNETAPSSEVEVLVPTDETEIDNDPPNPNPAQWLTYPYEKMGGYHSMAAVVATDDLNPPVWYKFVVVSGYGKDSDWLETNEWLDCPNTGLVAYRIITCDSVPGSDPAAPNPTNSTGTSKWAATNGDVEE